MLHSKTHLIIQDGVVYAESTKQALQKLPDGDYTALILDNTKNKALPQLKYLFGVVFKLISEKLPTHPPIDALYRYFEELYAPTHICNLPGDKTFVYRSLKNEKAREMNEIIESIIHHVITEWGIEIEPRDSMKAPEAKELWAGAYTEQWNLPLANK